jgi:hypothetical protein
LKREVVKLEIIDYVKQFLDKNKICDLTLSLECNEGAVATYDYKTNELAVNTIGIEKEAIKLNLTVQEVVSIVISHELGHYLDSDIELLHQKKRDVLDKIDDDVFNCDFARLIDEGVSYVIQAEKNAWYLGVQFVPEELKQIYLKQSQENLYYDEIKTRNEIGRFIELVLEREKIKRSL